MRFWIVVCLVLSIALSARALENPPTGDDIARDTVKAVYYAGKASRARILLKIHDGRGGTRERDIILSRKDVADLGRQKFFVYFKAPHDVRKMALLVHKNPGDDDARWLYVPALDLVKRIAAQDKRTSFAGSDFLYEDVSGRDWRLDAWTLASENDVSWTISGTPKDDSGVEYSRVEMVIDKKDHLPRQATYYDAEGKARRIITVDKIETIEGHPTILSMTAKDLSSGSHSVMTTQNITYDVDIDDDTFTEASLRRPPRDARK